MSRSAPDDIRLKLLDGFELSWHGERVCLPLGANRLLSYLALREGGAQRMVAAEALWPRRRGDRAAANLRSALWQTRSFGRPTLIDCVGTRIRLTPVVHIDLRDVLHVAHEIAACSSPDLTDCEKSIAALTRELLPDWSDNWLLFERERWDQVRLHALEILARHLIAADQYLLALEAALTAVAIEPIRESANRAVIEVHLAEGNAACAIKHGQRYRDLLRLELGVTPSQQMDRLLQPLVVR